MIGGFTLGQMPANDAMSSLNFEEIVDQFYPMLYRFALSLARNEADACDLTQQTFYIWANKGNQLRDLTKVKTWLFTTLHREFLESRRRMTRFPHVELDSADEIVLQCKSGARSARALKLLQEAGFGKLANLEGGIVAWSEQVDPSVPKY